MAPRNLLFGLLAVALASAGAGAVAGAPLQPPDDVSWNRIALGAAGPDRALHTMVYDPANELFVVFGGIEADPNSDRMRNDIFTLDATDPTAQWQRISMSGLEPRPVYLHSATYDPVRQRMIVYGGMTDRSGFQGEQVVDGNEVWFLDLSDPDAYAWTREVVAGNPVDRFAHAAAYVPTYDALVIAGGAEAFDDFTSSAYALLLGETPMQWVRLANAGFNARAGHAMIHDGGARLLAYGGLTNFESPNPTREIVQLNIAGAIDGADRWTRLSTATPGLERALFASAFDPGRGLWWVQGGFQSSNTILNDLSYLDLNTSRPEWTRTLEIANGPGTRFGNPAALDPARSRFVTQGGSPDNNATREDTYELVMTDGPTATPTATTDATDTPSPTATDAPTETPTDSPTATATTETATPGTTATNGITPTPTDTDVPTPTPTEEATATPTDESGEIYLPVALKDDESLARPTATATVPPTNTPPPTEPPTATPTLEPGVTPTEPPPTPTEPPPTPTEPPTPTFTPTATPSPTEATPSVEELGQLGGSSRAIARVGDFVLAGMGSQLVSIDASNEAAPTIVSRQPLFGALVQEITLTDAGAWVADQLGFGLYDVTDPANPALVGSFEGFSADELRVIDGVALAAGLGGTRVYDVSDPTAITRIDFLQTGGVFGLEVEGDRAYVAEFQVLRVLDVSDTANITDLGTFALDATAEDVDAAGTTVYLAQNDATLRVVDASDAANPTEVGQVDLPFGGAEAVRVVDDRAYVGNNFDGTLAVVDVADPAQPQLLGAVDPTNANRVQDLFAADDRVYTGNDDGGVRIFDVTDDAAPTELGDVDAFGWVSRLAAEGDVLSVAGPFSMLAALADVSNAAAPALASRVADVAFARDVDLADGKLYTFGGNDPVMAIYDVSDATTPQLLGVLPDDDVNLAAHGAVVGDRAYIADRSTGLWVGDVSDPANPQTLGTLALDGRLEWVEPAGDVVYVLDVQNDLVHAVDVADPSAPSLITTFNPGSERPTGLRVEGFFLYVTGGDPTLEIWQVANPAAPTLSGTFDTNRIGYHVVVQDGVAYMATSFGLILLDVSDSSDPIELGRYLEVARFWDVALDGDVVYVVGETGLRTARVTLP